MNRLSGITDIIFDLDGTLWNSTRTIAKAWNHALQELQLERRVTHHDIQDICGMSFESIFAYKFPELPVEEQLRLGHLCTHYEHQYTAREGGELYPGVIATLEKLKTKYTLYIVSNCQAEYMQLFLDLSNTRSLFSDTECYGSTGRPKAENLADIASRNKMVKPVYIGDTGLDRSSAEKAGIEFIQAAYGYGDFKHPLRVEHFTDLLPLFDLK